MEYYITKDDKGFVNVLPELEPKDGYTKVEVAETDKEYFLRYYDKYRVDDDNRLQAPGNLPDISIDTLLNAINQQQTQIETVNGQITSYKELLDNMTKASATLGGQQAQLQVAVNNANKAMASIGAAVAQLQVSAKAQDASTTETTTDNK
ncbi:hypothetical protein [Lentilactobacillus sp. SPB1-3]|uniref:Uncharacterized protein n=1 Tax=Lentilactobacillus terminaliae TaxID=3003483 RepID=A0ACD5DD02_9LACO|nr:hypothetical protein [Lentilactobacillus sp. SPB1-3]MCZ0978107.1 hypothetical protein [Lentilactobacillus sp. SPB1-3]